MLIGIDFDNTIAGYDDVFVSTALDLGFLPEGVATSKKQVHDLLMTRPDGERDWMCVQGQVYGARMTEATLIGGVADFLLACKRASLAVCIVSHKTEFGHFDENRINLREAAATWMEKQGFFAPDGFALSRDVVFFEPTRQAKVARIAALGCTHFIDDLIEVFQESEFPEKTRRFLFSPGEGGPLSIPSYPSWLEIAGQLLGEAAAEKLTGGPVISVEPVHGGGNNRTYCVTTDDTRFALKSYLRQDGDPRNRLEVEFGSLSFLKRHGVRTVPAAIASDPATGFALYEWLDGERLTAPGVPEITAALDFVSKLKSLGREKDARTLPLASESCLSAAELIAQVQARLTRLLGVSRSHPQLSEFLERSVGPMFSDFQVRAINGYAAAGWQADRDIDETSRTLSPSDFGFHNALKGTDGRLCFLDMEYFGWDDPVRLVADFLLHPGMQLGDDLKRLFAGEAFRIFSEDGNFKERFDLLYPLIGLRWVLIILNEFLPERQERRRFASRMDPKKMQDRQLAKALELLETLRKEGRHSPYGYS